MADTKEITPEEQLARWLADPEEYGEAPKSVTLRNSLKGSIIVFDAPVKIDIYDYEMPGGEKGRGFVYPMTGTFKEKNINDIQDGDLVIAYCGWVFLLLGLQQGQIQTEFEARDEEAFLSILKDSQISDIKINGQYKIGDNEFFEYTGMKDGLMVKGAGTSDEANNIIFNRQMPEYALPAIYFLLGLVQNR